MDLVGFSRQSAQMTLEIEENDTVEITLPAGCLLPTPATGWTKHTDGKISARYTHDELLTALAAVGWLETGADRLSQQGLAIYARLRIGEDLIAAATDNRREKLIIHWCQLYADLAIAEPDLVGGGHGEAGWRHYAQEVSKEKS